MDTVVLDVEGKLLDLRRTCAQQELRLQHLMALRLPSRAELTEALELSNSLQLLSVQIRRLRLDQNKERR